ncbi:MAG TPA: mannose-1-phosphate guanylyltransferase [Candidatus Cloacimonadota bacterium]|nr:mannose-1-phosphate guanylyltransferase [Candidatus Cloacimonadota bacterium]
MIALIMAGGFGTRFWPSSRADLPKQFLKVVGDKSMLQLTVERLEPLIPLQKIYIVTAASQVPLVKEHLPLLPRQNIIIEPFGMNTAPCIGLSAGYLKRLYPTETAMIVLPADHVIKDTAAFLSSLKEAERAALEGNLVTFGIIPEYPATGYGYIEAGEELQEGVRKVLRFKEKPDYDTALGFLSSGNFFWNSGMFAWQIGTICSAFKDLMPDLDQLLEQIGAKWESEGSAANIDDIYAQMPRVPIDIGILEAATNRVLIPVQLGWSDVGSWKALADLSVSDAEGNSFMQSGIAFASSDNYVYSNKFTALIGVDKLCVIETPDAILVCTKDRAEEVKKVVDYLKAKGDSTLL